MPTNPLEFYPMPITLKRCADCARELPLQMFRRRRGTKSHMGDICKVCKPEKTLAQRTSPELDLLVKQGRANPIVIDAIKRRRREHWAHSVLSAKATRRRRDERRRNWNLLLLDGLRDELTYAKRRMREMLSDDIPERSSLWVEFYSAYADILRLVIDRAGRNIPVPNTPIKPTMDEINPRYWLSEAEYSSLAVLYSSCVYIPGRRARLPQFLRWEEIKGKPRRDYE